MERKAILQDIQRQPEVDVLIIGGGVNGIGTFRDLALQGVRVLLAEKDDFCRMSVFDKGREKDRFGVHFGRPKR